MIGSGNTRTNVINRKPQQQYLKIDDDKINTPKQKYYQNAYNNLNTNNLTGNNSMNKQNNRINMGINNNIINSNMNNINNNINHSNNNLNQNNNINKALMIIRAEFKKKDDKIRELELKVAELEKKINSITKTGNFQSNNNNQALNNNYMNSISNMNSQKKFGKNFTFSENYSEEINPAFNKRDSNLNKTPDMNYNNRVNPFRNTDDSNNTNKNNFYNQTKSANQYKIMQNNDNDNDYTLEKKGSKQTNYGDNARENSIITGNSSNFQGHSKMEVKSYLKEVKSRVNQVIFKEFIKNIKLLTNSKDKNGVDKKSVVDKVRILFGEEYKDLYIKFESIIGINN